jgi:hypothetical protein
MIKEVFAETGEKRPAQGEGAQQPPPPARPRQLPT